MIRFYVDVAGDPANDKAIVAAGYLGNDIQWGHFEHVWAVTLKLAGAKVFHATDFFACQRQFKLLEKGSPRHAELASLFAGAAFQMTGAGHAFGVNVDDFNQHMGPFIASIAQTPHGRMLPSMFAVAHICMLAAQHHLPEKEKAEVLIEDGKGVGEIVAWLEHLKRADEPWTRAFVSFSRVPKSEPPVQAADYLAFEAWREITAVLANKERTWEDVTRETFKILATGPAMAAPSQPGRVSVTYAEQEHFRAAQPLMKAFIASARGRAYRPPPWHFQLSRRIRRAGKQTVKTIRSRVRGWALCYWYRAKKLFP